MLRGFGDAEEVRAARLLSDAAIAEFTDPKDQARQFQYRCHLETLAGNYAIARQYLVCSIRMVRTQESDFSHAAVPRLLAQAGADDPHWQQEFTVSHWLRLGARICLTAASEQEDFLAAYLGSNLNQTYTSTDARTDFPIHNILRFLAVIEASRDNLGGALSALGRLHDLDPIGKNQFIMAMILMAGQAEVAALLWSSEPRLAQQLLTGHDAQREALRQLFERMMAAGVGEFPRLAELVTTWTAKIDELLNSDKYYEQALAIRREIGDRTGEGVDLSNLG